MNKHDVPSAFGGISRWLAVGCVMTARARGGVAWGCVIASRATRAVELRASQTLDRLPGSVLDAGAASVRYERSFIRAPGTDGRARGSRSGYLGRAVPVAERRLDSGPRTWDDGL